MFCVGIDRGNTPGAGTCTNAHHSRGRHSKPRRFLAPFAAVAAVHQSASQMRARLKILSTLCGSATHAPIRKPFCCRTRLVNQRASLERSTSRGGKETIDNSQGAHDDVANVVAGVAHCVVNRDTS